MRRRKPREIIEVSLVNFLTLLPGVNEQSTKLRK
jgi:hypothetical protein